MPHFGTIYHGFYIYIFNTGKPGIYVIGFVIPGLKKVWSFADKAQNLILYMHLKNILMQMLCTLKPIQHSHVEAPSNSSVVTRKWNFDLGLYLDA